MANRDWRWVVGAIAAAVIGLPFLLVFFIADRTIQTQAAGLTLVSGPEGLSGPMLPARSELAMPPPGIMVFPGDPSSISETAVTVLAAGDIANCGSTGDEQTAAIVAARPGATVLALGDTAYPNGTAADFADCFDPAWGQFRDRIRPVPGNHEYHSLNADPYFAYFGAAAGASANTASRGYYSFDLGAWHIVALNSEQDIGVDGAQLAWLRADLAGTTKQCILAYWHRPRFIADEQYADFADLRPFWDDLYAAGADIVLNGHSHTYQRYRPMNPAGEADGEKGIREFVVGTGGASAYSIRPDSRRDAGHSGAGFFGVLELRLGDTGYEWTFLPAAGQTYTDSGTGRCR